jgi:hypothetical protein
MPDDLKNALSEFVRFAQKLRGDEKSEAQTFLDHFFRAFGHKGADPLAFLLELNLACATKEKAGQQITPPGLPLRPEDRANFVTSDCIQPPGLS